MRVAVWNLRHGGGSRRVAITDVLIDLAADIVVLPEWSSSGPSPVDQRLMEAGYHVVRHHGPLPPRQYGVAVASRHPLEVGALEWDDHPWALAHTILQVDGFNLHVIGTYVASGSGDMVRKRRQLAELTRLSRDLLPTEEPIVLAGDLNCDHLDDTGRFDTRLVGMPEFTALVASGWTDAYRTLHGPGTGATWWTPGGSRRGFRLDHVLLAGPARVTGAEIRTSHGDHLLVRDPSAVDDPRTPASDHAMLIVDLDLSA